LQLNASNTKSILDCSDGFGYTVGSVIVSANDVIISAGESIKAGRIALTKNLNSSSGGNRENE